MRKNFLDVICGALIALTIGASSVWADKPKAVPQTPLTEAGQKLETRYADQLKRLRTELTAKVPQNDQAKADTLNKFLASDALDAKFAKYVVLLEATPRGLAEFALQGKEHAVPIGEYAWFKDNSGAKSHPVGQKKPNPFGLYDIYGNVCERISDTYARNYFAQSPKVNPTGPSQVTKSLFEYKVIVPRSGKYSLTANVVTANYDQRLNISVNDADSESVLEMPFTVGNWQDSEPVTLTFKEGENTLRFWRNQPPQYGLAIKDFTLAPVK